MESGAGAHIVPLILFYLNLDEFAEVTAAATLYGLDLKHFVQNSAFLTKSIFYDNHFKYLTSKPDHPHLNFDRLWQLSPDEFLIETRLLNLAWQPLYKTDIVMPLLVEKPSQKPLVSFNPVHDIMVLVESEHFFVLSYGGRLRADRGQLVYAESVCSWHVSFVSWNPTGTYLIACFIPQGQLNTFCDRQLVVYKFFPDHGFFKKNIITSISLRGSGTMLTPLLWIDETSFIWCKDTTDALTKITLSNFDNSVSVTDLVANVKDMFQIDNGKGGFICLDNFTRSTPLARSVAADDFTCPIPAAIFGNFFARPVHSSPYLYCVLNCPIHCNLHDCIGVIKRDTLKICTIITLPGQVKEIRCNENKIFVLFSRCLNINETTDMPRVRPVSEFPNCPYHIAHPAPVAHTWWDNKKTDLCWFTDDDLKPTYMSLDCCPINYVVHKNRSYRQRCLFDEICDSRAMQVTTHFCVLTSFRHDTFASLMQGGLDVVEHQRIYINHHHIDVSSVAILNPADIAKTMYYHPTKGLVFVHEYCDGRQYPYFGLLRSALIGQCMYFPEFDINQELEPPFNYPMLSEPVSVLDDL
jgi:hypothetical protein